MTSAPARFLTIDEEGYLLQGDHRITDEDQGHITLDKIKWLENGAFGSVYFGAFGSDFYGENNSSGAELDEDSSSEVILEPFDSPLVAINIFLEEDTLTAEFRYNFLQEFKIESLSLDEFDRFHGMTEKGIPFVCHRKAQAALFNIADEYDDDSITLLGKKFELPPYFQDELKVEKKDFWTERYQKNETGWDLQQPSPILVDMLPRMKVPPSRVLVLGCGHGHDAVYFAKQGHFVTAVDISPEALSGAQKLYAAQFPTIQWVQADIFNLPRNWDQSFDLIWEHTCFCAINPKKRNDLIGIWRRLLSEHGQLLAVFFAMEKRGGPPFGASEWELRQRLQKYFRFLYWGRWRTPYPNLPQSSNSNRLGKELFILANKKSFS